MTLFHRLSGLGIALLLSAGASARGQIFYEPAEAQHVLPSNPPRVFYYAGSDPRVFDYVARSESRYSAANASNGTRIEGNGVQPIAVSPREPIYSDVAPYQNMRGYGWTPTDAVNEANPQAPRYYRRVDSPPPGAGGVWIVPANGQPAMQIEPPRQVETSGGPGDANHGIILIIPKHLLQPAPKPADRTVAAAQ